MNLDGKIVTVRKFSDGVKICAIDQPNSITAEHEVKIIRSVREEKILLAFHFRRKEKTYCTKVVEECLKVEETDCCDGNPKNISDNHWFVMEKNGNGKNYNLHTLCAPKLYLSLLFEKPYTFTLTDFPQKFAEFLPSKI